MSINPPDDHSQHGEYSTVIKPYFEWIAKRHDMVPLAVECGCHGKENSNTYDLVTKMGFKALWIDASPRALDLCRAHHEMGIDIVEGALVPSSRAHVNKVMMHIHKAESIGHDSLLPDWKPKTATDMTVTVPTLHLPRVLYERAVAPNFALLSVDLEGMDEEILVDFFRCSTFKPLMVIVERQALGDAFETYMRMSGYFRLTTRGANDIWVRHFVS